MAVRSCPLVRADDRGGQAALPVPAGEDHPLARVAPYLFEAGRLKHVSRAGWLLLLLRIPQPETVAEHSFRVAIAGMALTGHSQPSEPGETD
jgi:putative hydrolases of HD superfamily